MKVMHVVGARPNFMKAAPVLRALDEQGRVEQVLVHTGQHYDRQMSQVFFDQLGLPCPDADLGVGSGSHAAQTAGVMLALEPLLLQHRPDWTVVVGDVNSTVAAALTAKKLDLKVAHVEAGLRSFDRTMPEEHNRVLADQLADLLFTPSRDADANLRREGIPAERIEFVGNVMIDSLVRLLPRAREGSTLDDLRVRAGGFALVTLHRPSNVDQPEQLAAILQALERLATRMPVLFPIHPRTRARLSEFGLDAQRGGGLRLLDPIGYLEFLQLESEAALVLTDSGGVQEETTYLGVPCLTLRPNTERPITISQGTNRLAPLDPEGLGAAIQESLAHPAGRAAAPELWDGRTGERIAAALLARSQT